MNWDEYKALALRTESIPDIGGSKEVTRLLHGVMGVCTELAELSISNNIANRYEEIGDVFWYLAIIDDVIDYSSGPPDNLKAWENGLQIVGDLQDVIKRVIFYGTPLDEQAICKLRDSCWQTLNFINGLKVDELESYELYWIANITKLEKRYPELLFDKDKAINRNVEEELSHMPTESKSTEDMPYEEFNSLVDNILNDAQKKSLGMSLCFKMAINARELNMHSMATAFDILYKEIGAIGWKGDDATIYSFWEVLGYPLRRDEARSKLESWT